MISFSQGLLTFFEIKCLYMHFCMHKSTKKHIRGLPSYEPDGNLLPAAEVLLKSPRLYLQDEMQQYKRGLSLKCFAKIRFAFFLKNTSYEAIY